MTARYYMGLPQRSDEWYEARRGIVTASDVGKLVTHTLKTAANETSRRLVHIKAAERITGHVEETFTTDAMMRGIMDEPLARDLYAATYAPVVECGFVTASIGGNKVGYSPDGLVGTDGLIEVKSREPHLHVAIILTGDVPHMHMAQMQMGMLVTGRKWADYISYAGGLPMWTKRIEADPAWFAAITEAIDSFEADVTDLIAKYDAEVKGLPATERIDYFREATI